MSKGYKKYLIVGLSAVGLFASGSFVGAANDWQADFFKKANKDLSTAANNKFEELSEGGIEKVIKDNLNEKVSTKKTEVTKAIEEYYNQKVEGIEETEEYKEASKKLNNLSNNIVKQYKDKIDEAFEGE